MMSEYHVLPDMLELTEEKLEKIGHEHTRAAGMAYFREGRVKNPMVWGNTLWGEIAGSGPENYKIRVEIGKEGKEFKSYCTCPYGGRYCKHAFAILYTWVKAQSSFKRLENIQFLLSKKSNHELVKILLNLVKKEPSIIQELNIDEKYLYETPEERDKRREDFYRVPATGYQYTQQLLEKLRKFQAAGIKYMKNQKYKDASKVFQVLILKGFEHYGDVDDVTDILSDFLEECIHLYFECIDKDIKELEDKKEFFNQIFEMYMKDTHGFSHLIMTLLLDRCNTHPEYRYIEGLCKGSLAGSGSKTLDGEGVVEYDREKIVELLLALYDKEGKDDKYISLCRQEISSWRNCIRLCGKLEAMGRIDEAIRYYKRAIEEETGKYPKSLIRRKLAELYERQGQKDKALDMYLTYFEEREDLEIYEKIKSLSCKIETWENTRNKILISLSKGGKCHTLIDALLKEGDINACIKLVMRPNQATKDIAKVAEAAEEIRPREAMALFKKLVNYYVGLKRREDYKLAVKYLRKIKKIYILLNEKNKWETYIHRLIKQNDRKKALIEELSHLHDGKVNL
jgi:uncharacterized Zn finger protein